jgi:chromosome segregation ATPase
MSEKLALSEKHRRLQEAELAAARHALHEEQSRREDVEAHREELLSSLAQAEKGHDADAAARARLEAKVSKLEESHARERAARKAAESRTAAEHAKTEAVQAKVESQADLLAEAAAARERIRDQTAEANRLLSVANARKAGVEELAKRAVAQLKVVEDEKDALAQRIEGVERRAAEAVAETARLLLAAKESAEALATERAHAQHSRERAERAEAAMSELCSAGGELGRLRVERGEWLADRARLTRLEQELARLGVEIERGRAETENEAKAVVVAHEKALAAVGARAAAAAGEAAVLREALVRADGERAGLERMMGALEAQAREHRVEMAARASEVEQARAEAVAAGEAARIALEAARGVAEAARAEAEEARRDSAASAKAADILRESLKEAWAGRATATAELEIARAETVAVNEQRNGVQIQLALAEVRLGQTGERLAEADVRLGAAAEAATEAEAVHAALRAEGIEFEHRVREAEAERDRLCDAVEALQQEKVALEQLARHVHTVTLPLPVSAGRASGGGLAGRGTPSSAGRAALAFAGGGGSPEGIGGSRLRFTPAWGGKGGEAGTPLPGV